MLFIIDVQAYVIQFEIHLIRLNIWKCQFHLRRYIAK